MTTTVGTEPWSRQRNALRALLLLALIVVSAANLLRSLRAVVVLALLGQDPTAVLEQQLAPVRKALLDAGVSRGEIGYVPATVLDGATFTSDDNARWVHYRYVMIPYVLKPNALEAPYVILQFDPDRGTPAAPVGFSPIYVEPSGFVLLANSASR